MARTQTDAEKLLARAMTDVGGDHARLDAGYHLAVTTILLGVQEGLLGEANDRSAISLVAHPAHRSLLEFGRLVATMVKREEK